MSDITRSESIKQLHRLKADIISGLAFVSKTKDKHLALESLDMAIASLETDEAYQLEYESTTKKDLGVDFISRAQAQAEIEMNASRYTIAKERGGFGQVEWSDQLIKVSDAVNIIRELPSVAPQLSSGLENPTKKYCGCCTHWKRKGVKKIGDKPTSYGKCTKLSISGFDVEATFNDNCSSEGLE